jgi:hypothetical protein
MGVVPMAAALLGASSVRSRLSSGALSSRLAHAAVVSELVKPSQSLIARQKADNSRAAQQSAQNRTFSASNRSPFSAFGSRPGNKSQSAFPKGKRSASEQTENWSLPELNISKALGAFADVLMQVATMSGNVQAQVDDGQSSTITRFYDPTSLSYSLSCVDGGNYSYLYIFRNSTFSNVRASFLSSSATRSVFTEAELVAAFNSCVYQGDPPPAFEATSVTATSGSEFILSVDVDKSANVYYAVSSEKQFPTRTMVKEGGTSWTSSGYIVAESTISSGSLDDDFAASVTVAGLTAGTKYYVYLVAEDAGNDTLVSAYEELEFVTPSIPSFNSATGHQYSHPLQYRQRLRWSP